MGSMTALDDAFFFPTIFLSFVSICCDIEVALSTYRFRNDLLDMHDNRVTHDYVICKLIFWLAVIDCFWSISLALSFGIPWENSVTLTCVVVGMFLQFFGIMSLCWHGLIASYLFYLLKYDNTLYKENSKHSLYKQSIGGKIQQYNDNNNNNNINNGSGKISDVDDISAIARPNNNNKNNKNNKNHKNDKNTQKNNNNVDSNNNTYLDTTTTDFDFEFMDDPLNNNDDLYRLKKATHIVKFINIEYLQNEKIYRYLVYSIILISLLSTFIPLYVYGDNDDEFSSLESYKGTYNYTIIYNYVSNDGTGYGKECWIDGYFVMIYDSALLISLLLYFIVVLTSYLKYQQTKKFSNAYWYLFLRLLPWFVIFSLFHIIPLIDRLLILLYYNIFEDVYPSQYGAYKIPLWLGLVHNYFEAALGIANLIVWHWTRRVDPYSQYYDDDDEYETEYETTTEATTNNKTGQQGSSSRITNNKVNVNDTKTTTTGTGSSVNMTGNVTNSSNTSIIGRLNKFSINSGKKNNNVQNEYKQGLLMSGNNNNNMQPAIKLNIGGSGGVINGGSMDNNVNNSNRPQLNSSMGKDFRWSTFATETMHDSPDNRPINSNAIPIKKESFVNLTETNNTTKSSLTHTITNTNTSTHTTTNTTTAGAVSQMTQKHGKQVLKK